MNSIDPKAPTSRFSDRAEDYSRYRPGYPPECFASLVSAGINRKSLIVDVGCGTGAFTEGLLSVAGSICGVEPNAEMRAIANQRFAGDARFRSVGAAAEDIGLESDLADAVSVAQAFHWFDRARALREFRRILKPGGLLILVWNRRRDTEPFMRAYEALLKDGAPEYGRVNHRNLSEDDLEGCFDSCQALSFPHVQVFDKEGLFGRAASASYVPGPRESGHTEFYRALDALFENHAHDGVVEFHYDTEMYLGPIRRRPEEEQ